MLAGMRDEPVLYRVDRRIDMRAIVQIHAVLFLRAVTPDVHDHLPCNCRGDGSSVLLFDELMRKTERPCTNECPEPRLVDERGCTTVFPLYFFRAVLYLNLTNCI